MSKFFTICPPSASQHGASGKAFDGGSSAWVIASGSEPEQSDGSGSYADCMAGPAASFRRKPKVNR